uniref:carboxy-terminal domain RNA polymerase II polypeptide A small phosphatase 1 n=1 Tax=Erigeron canadensis TaxID=72917 RepID=UPI001CB9D045|nr:carboxy-terminal domain RNA polymerase II polypeptide A small phosphatase 1 [Erigeron canadensis]
MVSKIKNPKRSPAKHTRHRRKKTPVKSATKTASVVVSSINKSIYTCHRRLVKIFSKIVKIATPKRKSSARKGYKVLKSYPIDLNDEKVRRSLFQEPLIPLPPIKTQNQKTVFLDLDETLIHSVPITSLIRPRNFDFVVKPLLDGERVDFYVLKRPFVDDFLEFLSQNGYEIVVFTAGIQEYASLVLDKLDKKGLISYRLYRDSCKEYDGKFVKDLSGLGRDLKNAVIVDDNPNSFSLQPENAIQIRPFVDNLEDIELKKLMDGFFDKCNEFEDLRDALKKYDNFGNLKCEELIEDCGNSENLNFQALVEV